MRGVLADSMAAVYINGTVHGEAQFQVRRGIQQGLPGLGIGFGVALRPGRATAHRGPLVTARLPHMLSAYDLAASFLRLSDGQRQLKPVFFEVSIATDLELGCRKCEVINFMTQSVHSIRHSLHDTPGASHFLAATYLGVLIVPAPPTPSVTWPWSWVPSATGCRRSGSPKRQFCSPEPVRGPWLIGGILRRALRIRGRARALPPQIRDRPKPKAGLLRHWMAERARSGLDV